MNVLRQPLTLQKSLEILHCLAQKWHKIGTKDFVGNHNLAIYFPLSASGICMAAIACSAVHVMLSIRFLIALSNVSCSFFKILFHQFLQRITHNFVRPPYHFIFSTTPRTASGIWAIIAFATSGSTLSKIDTSCITLLLEIPRKLSFFIKSSALFQL